MKISVVIPTYNRNEKLKAAIESVLEQSISANEIIVVDNGTDFKTKNIVSQYSKKNDKPVVKYIKNPLNSLTVAKNIGGKCAQGDIILFLDDDDRFDSDYIKEIMKIYYEHPDAFIVQGNIEKKNSIDEITKMWNAVWDSYYKFFYLCRLVRNKKEVLPSGKNIAPLECDTVINCQWASGGCSSIKKEVLHEFSFDEKLIKYSYCEDVDFSYRVYKRYPKSIYLAPKAKLLYNGSFNKSTPVKKAVIMEKAYNLYFVSKNLGKNINYVLFFWSELGMFLQDLIFFMLFIRKQGRYCSLRLIYSLYAYYICIKHFFRIKNLDIEYINNRYLL